MRRTAICFLILLVLGLEARAQDSYPRVEIFGGYSYLRVDVLGATDTYENRHGWGASIAGNISGNIGVVAEFSGHYGKEQIPFEAGERDISHHTFLVGPRLSYRLERLTVFGHALAGYYREKLSRSQAISGFAMGLGGGVDLNLGKRVAVRLIQADYLPARLNDNWQNNYRIQTGLVLKLGGD
jgi:hypothetical protein